MSDDLLQDLGGGCHAWTRPDGGWGLSNAGLIVGRGDSLLVDTLFDVPSARRMLEAFAGVTAGAPIGRVVNTHGDGDHWFGNQLLADREIIASRASVEGMRMVGPAGPFARRIFAAYDFTTVDPVYPGTLFDRALTLDVGGTTVELIDVGPAHSAGDTIVHVPSARTVFTGDILFAGGTPIVWQGPVSNWLKACDLLLDLDVDTIVPGHGPLATKDDIRAQAAYLTHIQDQATTRHTRGMPYAEAVRDIDLGPYATLPQRERLAANVHAVYRDLDPETPFLDPPTLFGHMATLAGKEGTAPSE